MKVDPRRLAAFLTAPGACRVVLLHGDDEGLVRERSRALTRAVVGSEDDPFRIAELDRDQVGRLAEEASALAMTGGRRVVRLREVGDAATGAVQAVLRSRAEALVILEAPALVRGRLRTLLEASDEAAVIACYPEEGRALAVTVRETLAGLGVAIETEALAWVVTQLGADRGGIRLELDKLALYAAGGMVDMAAAAACLGDDAALSFEDALAAACLGQVAVMDRALELALADGLAPVGALRQVGAHFQRLLQARLLLEDGMTAAAAVATLRPPVFFRRAAGVQAMLALWNSASIVRLLEEVRQVEFACKQTGSRPDLLCRRLLAVTAMRAQRQGRAG